jgi:hypothetical protein
MHLNLHKLEGAMHSAFDCYTSLYVGGGMNRLRLLRGVCTGYGNREPQFWQQHHMIENRMEHYKGMPHLRISNSSFHISQNRVDDTYVAFWSHDSHANSLGLPMLSKS